MSGGAVNISSIACDARCQLDTRRNELKRNYDLKLRQYIDLYRTYQNLLYNRDSSGNPLDVSTRGANQTLAQSRRPMLIQLNNELNTIISELTNVLNNSKAIISRNMTQLAAQNRTLLENNLMVNQIGKHVQTRFNDLKSKEKLIAYNKKKNMYKKRVMWFLLMANIIIVAVLGFLFMKSSGGGSEMTPTQPATV